MSCPTCNNSEGEGPGIVTHYFKGQEQYRHKCTDPWHTSEPPTPAEKFAPISIDPNLRNTNWPTGESATTAPAAPLVCPGEDARECGAPAAPPALAHSSYLGMPVVDLGKYASNLDTSTASASAAQKTVQRVDSDEHITLIVGPTVRSIYGDSAELGHYKLAIAVYKMAMTAAVDVTASICVEAARLQAELQQAQDELQGALVAEKAYISANAERVKALEQVARLEKERDAECKWKEEAISEIGRQGARADAAQARVRELEGNK